MQDFTAPGRFAEKYERLKNAYDCLAKMNAQLTAAFKRQHSEITQLIARNEEVLRRCDEFFAAETVSTNGNGNCHHAGDQHK